MVVQPFLIKDNEIAESLAKNGVKCAFKTQESSYGIASCVTKELPNKKLEDNHNVV